jgi:hypothetical protein
MSLWNIMVGLVFGLGLLAGSLAAWWRFSIQPLWVLFAISLLAALPISLTRIRQRREFLQSFWDRTCTGIQWKRRFPDSSASQIREFLDIFVAAFAFPKRRRLSFSPDDEVLQIYRGLYPEKFMADMMELEFLVRDMKTSYGVDVSAFCREDITLGELYEHTRLA